jgi:hypothetical protein
MGTFRASVSRPIALVSPRHIGHIEIADLGKPAERRGRKATGLKRGAMTAGLPAGRKLLFEREQGDQRPAEARAHSLRRLPADTGYCTQNSERTA